MNTDLRTRNRRRSSRWMPAPATAAVVLALVAVFAAQGCGARPAARGTTRTGPVTGALTARVRALTCPTDYRATATQAPWVPAKPHGVDASARLAPDETPTTVVVCAYLHRIGTGGLVTGRRVLAGKLGGVRDVLAYVPRSTTSPPCTAILLGTDGDNFLLGLTYGSGTVWVSAPGNHCSGSGNGSFRAAPNLSSFARAAYLSGRWTSNGSVACVRAARCPNRISQPGRLGQDAAMVPAGAIAVSVVDQDGPTSRPVGGIAALVAALNSLSTSPDTGRCQPVSGGRPSTTYALTFDYRTGTGVVVRVSPGCRPSVSNGSLQAGGADPARVLKEMNKLLGHR